MPLLFRFWSFRWCVDCAVSFAIVLHRGSPEGLTFFSGKQFEKNCLDSSSLALIMALRRQNAAFFRTDKWHAVFKDGKVPDRYLVARLAVYDSETQACEEKADVRVIAPWLSLKSSLVVVVEKRKRSQRCHDDDTIVENMPSHYDPSWNPRILPTQRKLRQKLPWL